MTTSSPDSPPAPGLRSFPRPVWVLAAGLFVNAFGNFLPVFLVLYLTGRGASAAAAGLALTGYGAGRIAAPLLGGLLADRLARRTVIALGMSISAVAVAGLPLLPGLVAPGLLAVFTGLGTGLGTPAAAALLADLVPTSLRVQGFAVQRLAVNLGYAAGPAAAGLLAGHGYGILFTVEAASSALFAVLSRVALPVLSGRATDPGISRRAAQAGLLRSLARLPAVRLLLALVAVHVVYFQALATLPLVVRAAGYSPAIYGLLASLNGLLVIVVELPLAARTRRLPRPATVAVGFGLITAGIAGLGLTGLAPAALPVLIGCVVLYSLGEMVFDPVAQTYMTELAPAGLQARYQAAFATAVNTGFLLAPLLAAALYTRHPQALWFTCMGLGGAAAALVALDRSAVRARDRRLEQREAAA